MEGHTKPVFWGTPLECFGFAELIVAFDGRIGVQLFGIIGSYDFPSPFNFYNKDYLGTIPGTELLY
jgi:hypothetical protein